MQYITPDTKWINSPKRPLRRRLRRTALLTGSARKNAVTSHFINIRDQKNMFKPTGQKGDPPGVARHIMRYLYDGQADSVQN